MFWVFQGNSEHGLFDVASSGEAVVGGCFSLAYLDSIKPFRGSIVPVNVNF